MRRALHLAVSTVTAAATCVVGAGAAVADTGPGIPMLDVAHSTASGLNLWEISLAEEDPALGDPYLVGSLTAGGFDYTRSRTATGHLGDVTPGDDGTPDWLVSHRQPGGGLLLWVVGGGSDTTPRLWGDLRGGGWSWDDSRQHLGDVDGDGFDDVVSVHRTVTPNGVGVNIWVHRNTGTGFADPVLWQAGAPVRSWYSSTPLEPFTDIRYLLGDVSGDGRDDLVQVEGYGPPPFAVPTYSTIVYRVAGNTGGGFALSNYYSSATVTQGWSFGRSRDLLADVNGDAREDLVTVHEQPGGGVLLWWRQSTGIAVLDPRMLGDLRGGGWSYADSRQVGADVDGDGRDDVVSLHHQPGGGILVWSHVIDPMSQWAYDPEILTDLRDGGWSYRASRESVALTR